MKKWQRKNYFDYNLYDLSENPIIAISSFEYHNSIYKEIIKKLYQVSEVKNTEYLKLTPLTNSLYSSNINPEEYPLSTGNYLDRISFNAKILKGLIKSENKVINKIITDEAIGDMGKVKLPEDIDEKIASKLNESIYDSDKLLQYDNTYQIYPSNISTKMNRGLNIIIINGWLRVIGKKSDERFDNILLLDLLDIPELKPKKTNSAKIENIYNYTYIKKISELYEEGKKLENILGIDSVIKKLSKAAEFIKKRNLEDAVDNEVNFDKNRVNPKAQRPEPFQKGSKIGRFLGKVSKKLLSPSLLIMALKAAVMAYNSDDQISKTLRVHSYEQTQAQIKHQKQTQNTPVIQGPNRILKGLNIKELKEILGIINYLGLDKIDDKQFIKVLKTNDPRIKKATRNYANIHKTNLENKTAFLKIYDPNLESSELKLKETKALDFFKKMGLNVPTWYTHSQVMGFCDLTIMEKIEGDSLDEKIEYLDIKSKSELLDKILNQIIKIGVEGSLRNLSSLYGKLTEEKIFKWLDISIEKLGPNVPKNIGNKLKNDYTTISESLLNSQFLYNKDSPTKNWLINEDNKVYAVDFENTFIGPIQLDLVTLFEGKNSFELKENNLTDRLKSVCRKINKYVSRNYEGSFQLDEEEFITTYFAASVHRNISMAGTNREWEDYTQMSNHLKKAKESVTELQNRVKGRKNKKSLQNLNLAISELKASYLQ